MIINCTYEPRTLSGPRFIWAPHCFLQLDSYDIHSNLSIFTSALGDLSIFSNPLSRNHTNIEATHKNYLNQHHFTYIKVRKQKEC